MARHFWHTNKEYSDAVYEITGVKPYKAAYTDDLREYYLYYRFQDAYAVGKNLAEIKSKVKSMEKAKADWDEEERILTLKI